MFLLPLCLIRILDLKFLCLLPSFRLLVPPASSLSPPTFFLPCPCSSHCSVSLFCRLFVCVCVSVCESESVREVSVRKRKKETDSDSDSDSDRETATMTETERKGGCREKARVRGCVRVWSCVYSCAASELFWADSCWTSRNRKSSF